MKRLILCCDGTWNRADQEHDGTPCPTNVVQLALRVANRDGATPQIIYYDQGVGTGNLLDRLSGGAFGDGLEDNIHDAYRFLLANYEPGDQLFLFGFSRGAFTVRSLAGMIRKCGILTRPSVRHYRRALELYRSDFKADDKEAVSFRCDCSYSEGTPGVPISIAFVGVWDTVGALGIPLRGLRWLTRRDHQFHDTELSKVVKRAYHALAIDERRAPFEPTLWLYKPKEGQIVEQVWFLGAHSDVGGGYAKHGLSDIALEWLVGKAKAEGLVFAPDAANSFPLAPDYMQDPTNSKTGWYRLTKGIDREIGIARDAALPMENGRPPIDPTQSIHQSVLERWKRDEHYRPASLKAYFGRVGAPDGL